MALRSGAVLGLDAGGTATSAILVDAEGMVRWRGTVDAGSLTLRGVDGAAGVVLSIWEDVSQAADEAGISIVALAAGFAGGRAPERQEEVKQVLAQRLGLDPVGDDLKLVVTHDAYAALVGAFGPDATGCLLISGTGSICIVRSSPDRVELSGGWGWPLGDEGSGAWIGMAALRRAVGALQQQQESALADRVREMWNLGPAPDTAGAELMQAAAGAAAQPARFALLAPGVLEMARAGDGQAREIVTEAGLHLGLLIAEACERAGRPAGERLGTVLSGGFGQAAADLLEAPIRNGAGVYGHDLAFIQPLLPPEGGAALLGLQAAGFEPDQNTIERISDSFGT